MDEDAPYWNVYGTCSTLATDTKPRSEVHDLAVGAGALVTAVLVVALIMARVDEGCCRARWRAVGTAPVLRRCEPQASPKIASAALLGVSAIAGWVTTRAR